MHVFLTFFHICYVFFLIAVISSYLMFKETPTRSSRRYLFKCERTVDMQSFKCYHKLNISNVGFSYQVNIQYNNISEKK